MAEIQNNIGNDCWYQVKSEDNPADAVSRGLNPSKLKTLNLWWNGPSWLSRNKEEWPSATTSYETTEEIKKKKENIFLVTATKEDPPIISRFSSLKRAIRVVAYCQRFAKLCQKKKKAQTEYLSWDEQISSLQTIIKIVQKDAFSSEIRCLKNNKQIENKSKLLTLKPFIDEK